MAKSTKTLSGQSQKKFFRDLFRAEPGVEPDVAERLTKACASEIAQVRVRLPLVKRRAVADEGKVKAEPARTVEARSSVVAPPASEVAAFDPNAFSLIVVLRKGGRDALIAKLCEIGDATRLREIAKAQHVAIDPAVSDAAGLCEAIAAGTEKRVANRQAAAS